MEISAAVVGEMILRMGGWVGWVGGWMPPRRLSLALALTRSPLFGTLSRAHFFFFIPPHMHANFLKSRRKRNQRAPAYTRKFGNAQFGVRACVLSLLLALSAVLRVVLCFFNGTMLYGLREREETLRRDHKKWIKCASEWTDFDSALSRGGSNALSLSSICWMQGKWICV